MPGAMRLVRYCDLAFLLHRLGVSREDASETPLKGFTSGVFGGNQGGSAQAPRVAAVIVVAPGSRKRL